jgi:hypothetical protein
MEPEVSFAHYPALTQMAIAFFDEALEATGDDRQAAMLASAALMAAVDRLRDTRRRRSEAGARSTN